MSPPSSTETPATTIAAADARVVQRIAANIVDRTQRYARECHRARLAGLKGWSQQRVLVWNLDAEVDDLDELLAAAAARCVAVDQSQAHPAREAFERYGKGRTQAGLNLGDCFAYALAKATDRPLLFKGDDFLHADVRPAHTGQGRQIAFVAGPALRRGDEDQPVLVV